MLSQVLCMHMTKDESTLITGDDGKSVIVWDMSSGERKSTLKADGSVRCWRCRVWWLCVGCIWWEWRGLVYSFLGSACVRGPLCACVAVWMLLHACLRACAWERGRCVVLCIVGSACGSRWVACVGRRCASSIARVW